MLEWYADITSAGTYIINQLPIKIANAARFAVRRVKQRDMSISYRRLLKPKVP